MKLDLVKRTFNYAVVNKPSGMVCDASHTNNIITALTNEFTKYFPRSTHRNLDLYND